MLVRNKLFITMLLVFGNFCAAENVATSKDGKSEKNDRVEKIKQGALLGIGCVSSIRLGFGDHPKGEAPRWNCLGVLERGIGAIASTRIIQEYVGRAEALKFVVAKSIADVASGIVREKERCKALSDTMDRINDAWRRCYSWATNDDVPTEIAQKWAKEKDSESIFKIITSAIGNHVAWEVVGAGAGALAVTFVPAGTALSNLLGV